MKQPPWNERFSESLRRYAGETVMEQVMEGAEALDNLEDPRRRAVWIQGAMARLEALVPTENTRREIMAGAGCVFPQERIDQMRAEYQRVGDVDALLEIMRRDPDRYYAQPERRGNAVYVAKKPFDAEAFAKAATQEEKRRAYCHCPLVRDVDADIPPLFCYCGSGWYKRLWQGILERPVEVTTERCLWDGDEECLFEVRLPGEAVGNTA